MADHTPGPWKEGERHEYMISICAGRRTIARVECLRFETTEAELQANADLIVSAPALLAERDALAAECEALRKVAADHAANMRDELVKVSVNLSAGAMEGKIRDKLIELGWTPPESALPAREEHGG